MIDARNATSEAVWYAATAVGVYGIANAMGDYATSVRLATIGSVMNAW